MFEPGLTLKKSMMSFSGLRNCKSPLLFQNTAKFHKKKKKKKKKKINKKTHIQLFRGTALKWQGILQLLRMRNIMY